MLSRLSVYKARAGEPEARRQEYRNVVAALKALGRVAADPTDPAAPKALDELLRALGDSRTIQDLAGLPSFGQQAEHVLQASLHTGERDLPPDQWRRRQRDHLTEAPVPTPAIPVEETDETDTVETESLPVD